MFSTSSTLLLFDIHEANRSFIMVDVVALLYKTNNRAKCIFTDILETNIFKSPDQVP